jgi:hypothetical protein
LTTAPLIALLLAVPYAAGRQDITTRMQQVQQAKVIAQSIAPGATVDEVAHQTGPLGAPTISYLRCAPGAKCSKAFDELSATRRTAAWAVADHTLYVVFCGKRGAWHAAVIDLTPTLRPDPMGEDRRAVVLKQDPEQSKACLLQ